MVVIVTVVVIVTFFNKKNVTKFKNSNGEKIQKLKKKIVTTQKLKL